MEPTQNKPISDDARAIMEVAAIGAFAITAVSASLMLGVAPYVAGITVGAAILAAPFLIIVPSIFAVITLVLIAILLASRPAQKPKKRQATTVQQPRVSIHDQAWAKQTLYNTAGGCYNLGRNRQAQPRKVTPERLLQAKKELAEAYALLQNDYNPLAIETLLDEDNLGGYTNVDEDDQVFSELILPLVQLSLQASENFSEDYEKCKNMFFGNETPTAAWEAITEDSIHSFDFLEALNAGQST